MAFAFAILSGWPESDLSAQRAVVGTVFDSIRGRPLSGAVVTIAGADGRVRSGPTDTRGQFEFRDVPDGWATVTARAPALDSLALSPIEQRVQVGGRRSAALRLATPSLAAYQRAVCGAPLAEGQGIVMGDVRRSDGGDAAGAVVTAYWTELVVGREQVGGVVQATVDTTTAAGRYWLCGVPLETDVAVKATRGEWETAELQVSAGTAPLRWRSLRVGPLNIAARIRGRVLSPTRESLQATVELVGDSTRRVRANSAGHFQLPAVATRSSQLLVRAVGHTPRIVDIEPVAPETDLGDIELTQIPQELAGRIIEGRVVSREEFAFEERRKVLTGTFLDSTFLAQFPRVTTTVVAANSRFLRIHGGRGLMMRKAMDLNGSDTCGPKVFLDGELIAGNAPVRPRMTAGPDVEDALNRARRIEIYNAQFAPPEFVDFNGCGSVVIWTK